MRGFAGSAVWTISQSAFTRGLGLVVYLMVARALGLEGLGAVAMASLIVGLVQTSLIHPLVHLPSRFRTGFAWRPYLRLCWAATAGAIFLPMIAALALSKIGGGIVVWYVAVASLTILGQGLGVAREGALKANGDFKTFSILLSVASLVSAVATWLVHLGGNSAVALLLQPAVAAFSLAFLLWMVKVTPVAGSEPTGIRGGLGREYVGLCVSSSLASWAQRLDHVVIASVLGSYVYGVYSVAHRFVYAVIDLAVSPVGGVIVSEAGRRRDDTSALEVLLKSLLRFGVPLLTLAFVAVAFLSGVIGSFMGSGVEERRLLQLTVTLLAGGLAIYGVGTLLLYFVTGAAPVVWLPIEQVVRILVLLPALGLGALAGGLLGSIVGLILAELCVTAWRLRRVRVLLSAGRSDTSFRVPFVAFVLVPLAPIGAGYSVLLLA